MAILIDDPGTLRTACPGDTIAWNHNGQEQRGVVQQVLTRTPYDRTWPEDVDVVYLVWTPWFRDPNARLVRVADHGYDPYILVLHKTD